MGGDDVVVNFYFYLIPCGQRLSTSAEAQTVKKNSSNEVEKIIWEEKDNDHQVTKVKPGKTAADSFFFVSNSSSLHLKVLLHIEEKLFAYLHQALFREDNGKAVSGILTRHGY